MGQAYSDKLGLMGPLPFVQGIVCVRISPGSGSEGADADMWCLVALPPMARAGRRRPSTSVPRRGRTLAALPCGCRCGRRHLIGASSAAALIPLLTPRSPAAPPIDPEVRCSSFTFAVGMVAP